jgi:hypothetical protein
MDGFDTAQLVALAAVLGFASGIRLYAVLLIVGLVGYAGWAELPPGLALLSHPWVLAAATTMFVIEFFADKVPAVDSLWDAVHTFIRIPAGAALAASVFGFGTPQGPDSAVWALVMAIIGGSLAATSHFTKAGARVAVNTSPEPVSNVVTSTTEDLLVGGLLALVLAYPLVALGVLIALLAIALWLLPKLLRFVWRLFRLPTTAGPRGQG